MQSEEIQKLKSLIQTSSILSSSEKTEWLALLDVMNEKQLGELEGILSGSSAFAKATADKRKSEVGKSENQNLTPGKGGQAIQMPKLSHIMNLPKLGDFNQAPKIAPTVPQPSVQNKPSVFASKLKSIFQEKELPPGHPELELTQGKVDSGQWSVGSEKQRASKAPDSKEQVAVPKPFFPVKEKPLVSPQTAKSVKVPLPAPPKPKTASSAARDLPALRPLKIANLSPEATPQNSLKSDLPDSQQMNSLQDLAMFEPKTLQTISLDGLAKKIKSLIGKYGYFEVIFNIEKSRAYKNYISTGLKLLSDRSGFESLGGKENRDYLSKEQFEKFTDLLAKIQTG